MNTNEKYEWPLEFPIRQGVWHVASYVCRFSLARARRMIRHAYISDANAILWVKMVQTPVNSVSLMMSGNDFVLKSAHSYSALPQNTSFSTKGHRRRTERDLPALNPM